MDKNLASTPPKKIGISANDTLNQVRKERAAPERMEVTDIIKQDLTNNGMADKFDEIYGKLSTALSGNQYRMFRHGNSLLLLNILGKGVGEIHLMTADKPQDVVVAAQDFAKALDKAGYKQITTTTNNPQIAKVAKMAADSIGATYNVKAIPGGEYQIEWRK